jgi:hypothetical protein
MAEWAYAEWVGWAGALITLAAYTMRTMRPLRIAALGSNILFAIYGALLGIWPTLVLNLLLLPVNAWRLVELYSTGRKMRAASAERFDPVAALATIVPPTRYAAGARIFAKGDSPDYFYCILEGRVELEEIGVTLEQGDVFGEIAFFTEARERTVSARCAKPCRILAIDEDTFMRIYYLNPAFGLFIVRLVSKRLLDGARTNPELYGISAADNEGATLPRKPG